MAVMRKVRRRSPEDKTALKNEILKVAKLLFLKHGYHAVSIRKIADGLGISPTTIYLYYKDKSDMIYTLHQEGFKILVQQFELLKYVEDPFERLKAMGRIYIRFALDNPDFYELMFIIKGPMEFIGRDCLSEWSEGSVAFEALLATVNECKNSGYFEGQNSHQLALYVWSTIHGICSLKLQGHLDHVIKTNFPDSLSTVSIDQVFESMVQLLKNK